MVHGRMKRKRKLNSALIGCSFKDQSKLTYMNSLLCLLLKVLSEFSIFLLFLEHGLELTLKLLEIIYMEQALLTE